MKGTNSFIVEREISLGKIRPWVQVFPLQGTPLTRQGDLCLEGFRRVFGFTPRRKKVYRVTLTDVVVEEIKP